jgi:hypothetical protein
MWREAISSLAQCAIVRHRAVRAAAVADVPESAVLALSHAAAG